MSGDRELQLVRGLGIFADRRYPSRDWRREDRLLFDFLAIFHPEKSLEQRFKMIRDARRDRERKR